MQDRPQLLAALDALRKGGALAAEVLLVTTDWLEQAGSHAAPVHGRITTWTVRAWRAGGARGVGRASTAAKAIQDALLAAAAAPPEANAGPVDRQDARAAGLGTNDRRYPAIEHADRVELLDLAERAFVKTKEDIRLASLNYRQERTVRSQASTRGTECTETATRFLLEGAVETGPGRGFTQLLASRHFSDVASLPFGTDLRRRAEPRGRVLPGEPPARPLLIEPRCMAELARALAPAFAADHGGFITRALSGRTTPLRIAPPLLHVTDDAGLHSGLWTVAFDDRGVTPVPLTLLREGVVSARYHSPESARATRAGPTGHVRDGALHPSNLVIRPGARTRNMIHAELGDLLLLDCPPPLDLDSGRMKGPARVVSVVGGDPIGCYDVDFDIAIVDFLAGMVELAADQERHVGVDTSTAVVDRLRVSA